MEIVYTILYAETVVREDIPRLSQVMRTRIRKAIETKLTTHPELYGKPLRRSLAGYRKLRVGDYRIVFRVENDCVKVLIIQHRSVVYNNVGERM
jgi:mRNA interferase RelE/StbE